MAKYNFRDKYILNRMVALCRKYRFNESRQEIIKTAGLPIEAGSLSIAELRNLVDSRIANNVAAPIVGEMLRIESTFRYIRDIHTYNQQQVTTITGHLDATFPYLDDQNLWFVRRKMEQIYHLSGHENFRNKLQKQTKAVDKVRLLNRLIKNKKTPLLTPNYAEKIKNEICSEEIQHINEELKKTKSFTEMIRLNEEKIYLIDNSGWSRSQRFLAKNQTYNALYPLYAQTGNNYKADQARKNSSRFFSAYQKTKQFDPEYRYKKAEEEWEYR